MVPAVVRGFSQAYGNVRARWFLPLMCFLFTVTKEAYSRSTNHDGGRSGGESAPHQIITKAARLLVGAIRKIVLGDEAKTTVPSPSEQAWCKVIREQVVGLTDAEQQHVDATNTRTVDRIRRSIPALLEEGNRKRQRNAIHNTVSVSADTQQGGNSLDLSEQALPRGVGEWDVGLIV